MPSFKLFFQKEIRRFNSAHPITWQEFLGLVKKIFKEKYSENWVFQYNDVDNDRITVSSQQEWEEALNCLGDFVKIYIIEGEKACEPVVSKNEEKKETFINEESPLSTIVPECLQKLFAGKKILPFNFPQWLNQSNAIQVKSLPNGDVDLDIDLKGLFEAFLTEGTNKLREGKFQEGKELLENALKMCPTNQICLYNLACAEALLGKNPEAMDLLKQAIDAGYSNWQHILNDPDFNGIKDSQWNSEFQALVDKIKSVRIEEEEEPKQVEEPKQIKEEVVNQTEEIEMKKWETQLDQLKEMGFSDVKRNIELLEKHKGDMIACVAELLAL